MLLSLVNFSLIFLIKSIFLNYLFYDSNSFHFPIEISSLVLSSQKYYWSEHINWILLGWTGLPEEFSYLNKFDDYQWIFIFLSWLISYFLYNLFYFILRRKKYNRYQLFINNLRFIAINYLSLYIWSLNVIINCNSGRYNFFELFISLLIISFLSFGYPSLLLFLNTKNSYREYYKSLTLSYKNKFYIFVEMIFKNLIGIYIAFYYFWKVGNNYSLIIISFILILFNLVRNNFKNKINNRIYLISNILALIILIISEIEILFSRNIITFISKSIIMIILIIFNIFYIIKKRISKKETNQEEFIDIELGSKNSS
jgi:hypothetical protein